MNENKAVYVTKSDIKVELNKDLKFYNNKVIRDTYSYVSMRYADKTQEVGCQYDCKRDNLICTCRNLGTLKKKQEVSYYSRSFTDIGVGSVRVLKRKKVKKIYLPETDDRGVGSSDLSSFNLRKTRQHLGHIYYDNKRTSSKCVGGILEYNIGCVKNEKVSPKGQTISGSTSPRESTINRNIEIESNIAVKSLTNTSTQFEDTTTRNTTVKVEGIIHPVIIIQTDPKEMNKKTVDSNKSSETNDKPIEKVYSLDSLVQHVHNLESPSDEKESHLSVKTEGLMENKLELEYRKIFEAQSKSRDSKSNLETPIPDFKSASTLKKRFEALRRGLAKKEDSKKNTIILHKVCSQTSAPSRRDISINSDPPSLEGRSFSNTKAYHFFSTSYSRDQTIYAPGTSHYRESITGKKESSSAQWSSRPNDDDNEIQGVKGMFKLWGKKLNPEEDHYKRRCTPRPSYNSPKKGATKKINEVKKIKSEKEEKKESRKFFFFKKKNKEKPYKVTNGVTAGRCEVKDGLNLKINGSGTNFVPEDILTEPEILPDDYEEILRKVGLEKFLTHSIESQNSVQVRWNNKTYTTNSSTVFELIDNVYKNTGVVFRSKSQLTVQSSYKSNIKQHLNFAHQNIEAWMIPKTLTDRPKTFPLKIKCKSEEKGKNNIQVTISDQKWFIDKSKAFSHKIEVVLHSKNFSKLNKEESSEYLRIDIPKGFFVDSSSDDNNIKHSANQYSDEEVYKIVEYETESDLKNEEPLRNFDTGDHKQNSIKVTVSVEESDDGVLNDMEAVQKRDVVIQGSNVFLPRRCDVIGVGIVTQRDVGMIRKPILKIQDNCSDEESEHNMLKSDKKKCQFAESYLQEYYRHWTPLGFDLYSWCVSDSHLRCSSENTITSFNHQGGRTKSCPNIFDNFQTFTIVSPCNTSSCSQCQQNAALAAKAAKKTKWYKKCKKKPKDKGKNNELKRIIPKDSIEVLKRRRMYATSMKSQWAALGSNLGQSYSVQSTESKCTTCTPSTLIECPKLKKSCCRPIETRPKRRTSCKKHVSLPDCERMNELLAKQLNDLPEGILAFRGGGCEVCKKKGGCLKHAKVNPKPSCEIPPPPCKDSCEKMRKPPCAKAKSSCEKPPSCPGTPCTIPSCPATPPPCMKSPSCPPTPPPCKKPPSCPSSRSCLKPPSCPSSRSCLKPPPCPPSPPACPPSPPPCPPSPPQCPPSPPPCKKPQSYPPTPTPTKTSTPPTCLKKPPCPPSPPPCQKKPCPPSPPPCQKTPPCPPSPPPCRKPPPCPLSPPPCRKPPPCPPSPPPCRQPPPCPPSPPPCRKPPPCPPSPPPCRQPPPCPPSPPPCRKPPPCPPSPPPCRQPPPCPPSPPPCRKPPPCPPSPPPCRQPPPCPPSPPPCRKPPPCPPSPPPCRKPPPCPPSPPPCRKPPPCPPSPPSPPPCRKPPPCPPSPPPCRKPPPCPPSPPPCRKPPPCPPSPPPCRKPPPCPPSPPPCRKPPPCPPSPPPCRKPPPCPPSPPPCRKPPRCPPTPPPCKKPPPCPPSTPPCRRQTCASTPPPSKKPPHGLSPKSCPHICMEACPAAPPPCPHCSQPCPHRPPPCRHSLPCCPHSPPCTPPTPPCCRSSKPCPKTCKKASSNKKVVKTCPKFSTSSISYGSIHLTPDAPYYYSPINPCPPEYEKSRKKVLSNSLPCNNTVRSKYKTPQFEYKDTTPRKPYAEPRTCDQCRTSTDDFTWTTKDQISNQSSTASLYRTTKVQETIVHGQRKEDFPFMAKLSCETISSSKLRESNCLNKQESPRPPSMPEMRSSPPKTPAPPHASIKIPSPEAVKNKNKSKTSGLFLKMNPVSNKKKSTSSKDCLPQNSPLREDGFINLNSEEKITIRLKKETDSPTEIRDGLNIKVQDVAGLTLFERKDYRLQRSSCTKQSLLGDMYKASEVRRVTTNNSTLAIGTDQDRRKKSMEVKNDASIENLIEIQFKLKVTQGEKTTEINIASDGDKEIEPEERIKHTEPINEIPQEVFVVNDGSERLIDYPDQKNDINIRIVIKNFKTKSESKKSVNRNHIDYSKDFSKKISAKFHSVSTGYSDILHDDNVFSIHRATVDLTSSVDKSKTHSNRSEEIMSEQLELERGNLTQSSDQSLCSRCITTDISEGKSEDNEFKSVSSQKDSVSKDIQNNLKKIDTEKLTEHKYECTEDTDTEKPIKYDTEETENKQSKLNYDTEETDNEKQTEPKYDTFMSTDTDEPDTLPNIKRSKSVEVIVKPHTKDENKQLHVLEKTHEAKNNNTNGRDILITFTSDSSDHDDKSKANELSKDVTYAPLKTNYFRDSDSMNNYYRVESNSVIKEEEINRQVIYPTVKDNSECSNSNQSDVSTSENDPPESGGCMCSKVAARLKLASRIGEGGGCCCVVKPKIKKSEETTCDIIDSDYLQLDKNIVFVDVETQKSTYLTNKMISTNLSKSLRSSFSDNSNLQDQVKSTPGAFNVEDRKFSVRKTFSPRVNYVRECEIRKFNRKTMLSISDEDKIVLLNDSTPLSTDNEGKDKSKKLNDPLSLIHSSDILQSYETKKAVLEIYTEKTVSAEGERLVAKLPKFVYDRENEIENNYEAMATNTYKAVCKRKTLMMTINR